MCLHACWWNLDFRFFGKLLKRKELSPLKSISSCAKNQTTIIWSYVLEDHQKNMQSTTKLSDRMWRVYKFLMHQSSIASVNCRLWHPVDRNVSKEKKAIIWSFVPYLWPSKMSSFQVQGALFDNETEPADAVFLFQLKLLKVTPF